MVHLPWCALNIPVRRWWRNVFHIWILHINYLKCLSSRVVKTLPERISISTNDHLWPYGKIQYSKTRLPVCMMQKKKAKQKWSENLDFHLKKICPKAQAARACPVSGRNHSEDLNICYFDVIEAYSKMLVSILKVFILDQNSHDKNFSKREALYGLLCCRGK